MRRSHDRNARSFPPSPGPCRCTLKALTLLVTSARASMVPRLDDILTMSPFSMPFCAASSGLISQNMSGTSSVSHGRFRVMAPACQCSVTRYEVADIGDTGPRCRTHSVRNRASVTAGFKVPDCSRCSSWGFPWAHNAREMDRRQSLRQRVCQHLRHS